MHHSHESEHVVQPVAAKITLADLLAKVPGWFRVVLVLAAIGIIAVLGIYFYYFNNGLSGKQEVWGQFGDYIGGILNPVLTSLGFVAALSALIVSIESLSESRKAVQEARKTVAEAKRAHRIDRTIALMEYYFSDHMLKARRTADKWLIQAGTQDIKDLLVYMRDVSARQGWTAKDEYDAVWTLMEFFQTVSIHIEAETVDMNALQILIARYKTWKEYEVLGKVFEHGRELLGTELKFLEAINKAANETEGTAQQSAQPDAPRSGAPVS